jgi:putative copper resistance protein D
MDEASVLIWLIQFAASMAAFGGAAFRLYAPTGLRSVERWLAGEIRIAAAIAFAAALATVPGTAAKMAGSPSAALDPAILATVMSATLFGHVWRWHLLLGAVLSAAALVRPGPWARALVLVLAALNLASLALVGHAAMMAGPAGLGHELNQALHLLAAGAWLGGLVPLLRLLRQAREPERSEIPDRIREAVWHFSQMGYLAVGLIAVTGTINAFMLVGSFSALFGTAYGRLLSIKIGLFLMMVALAVTNRLRLAPRLGRDRAALTLFVRSVVLEQVLGLAILAAATLLGSWPPAAMGHAM